MSSIGTLLKPKNPYQLVLLEGRRLFTVPEFSEKTLQEAPQSEVFQELPEYVQAEILQEVRHMIQVEPLYQDQPRG